MSGELVAETWAVAVYDRGLSNAKTISGTALPPVVVGIRGHFPLTLSIYSFLTGVSRGIRYEASSAEMGESAAERVPIMPRVQIPKLTSNVRAFAAVVYGKPSNNARSPVGNTENKR